ncbi:hypothetical protein [Nocardiopsis coralliicola]
MSEDWIMPAPSRARHDYPTAVAAWVAHICPAHLTRAVDSLSTHPKGAALIAGRTISAMLDARGRDEIDTPLSLSAVIEPTDLDELLPTEDIELIRGLQVPVDTETPAPELQRRVALLRAEWRRGLPRHMLDSHQPRA